MRRNLSTTIGRATATLAVIALSFTACKKKGDTTNTISVNGSDTMLQVGLAWAEAYKKVNPDVGLTVNGEGSGTGIKALINGTVDIAQSSRAMKDSEKKQVEEAQGKAPVEHIVGYDGIAIYVHPDNPVKSLTMKQLHEIWAEGGTIDNWSQVGGMDAEINRVGRNNASGTYVFFQEAVCGTGVEFKSGTAAMPGSTAVVEFCSTTPSGIGYSGMGYKNEHVGWLAVSKDGSEAVHPSNETVTSGEYPIARKLYIYTVGEPTGAIKEYLDWIKSPEGQQVLADEDFVPLSN